MCTVQELDEKRISLSLVPLFTLAPPCPFLPDIFRVNKLLLLSSGIASRACKTLNKLLLLLLLLPLLKIHLSSTLPPSAK